MLILSLGAVVVGCAFLVVSFLTENTAWAWACIGACGLAAMVLVVDTIRRGRAPRELVDGAAAEPTGQAAAGEPAVEIESGSALSVTEPDEASLTGSVTDEPATVANATPDTEATQVLAVGEPPPDGPEVAAAEVDGSEPDEEDVDAADALAVGGLPTEVVVVDEHPRFHLVACPWLRDKPRLTLPVGEAIELGFTGCAQCKPSTTLAAQSRQR